MARGAVCFMLSPSLSSRVFSPKPTDTDRKEARTRTAHHASQMHRDQTAGRCAQQHCAQAHDLLARISITPMQTKTFTQAALLPPPPGHHRSRLFHPLSCNGAGVQSESPNWQHPMACPCAGTSKANGRKPSGVCFGPSSSSNKRGRHTSRPSGLPPKPVASSIQFIIIGKAGRGEVRGLPHLEPSVAPSRGGPHPLTGRNTRLK